MIYTHFQEMKIFFLLTDKNAMNFPNLQFIFFPLKSKAVFTKT